MPRFKNSIRGMLATLAPAGIGLGAAFIAAKAVSEMCATSANSFAQSLFNTPFATPPFNINMSVQLDAMFPEVLNIPLINAAIPINFPVNFSVPITVPPINFNFSELLGVENVAKFTNQIVTLAADVCYIETMLHVGSYALTLTGCTALGMYAFYKTKSLRNFWQEQPLSSSEGAESPTGHTVLEPINLLRRDNEPSDESLRVTI